MTRRKGTSLDLKWAMIRMGQVFPPNEIGMWLGPSTSVVEHVLANFRKHGLPFKPNEHPRLRGRRRMLKGDDIQVFSYFAMGRWSLNLCCKAAAWARGPHTGHLPR